MKLFAIITAGLMAAGGGVYFYSTMECNNSGGCPIAKTGGCCSSTEKLDCCAVPCPECATDCEACCAVCDLCCVAAEKVSASVKKTDCCAVQADCCLVGAACCTVEKVSAVVKPVESEGCCSACVSPTRTVTTAAKSIVAVK